MIITPGLLASIFAFTLFFPTVALFNIGPSTGFQLSALFAILYFFQTLKSKNNSSFLLWYGLVISSILFQLVYFIANDIATPIYYKNLIHFSFSIFIIYIAYKISRDHLSDFLRGFLTGGLFSAIFGLLQYFFWEVLNYDLFILRGINNCNSFANSGALAPNILNMDRIFGFAPEPSLFGLLMIVALVIAVLQKKIFHIISIGTAIFFSMSLSALLLVLVYVIYRFRKSNFFKITLFLILLLSFYIVKNIIENVDLTQISSEANLIERVSNIAQNGSFISRMNSILVSVDIISNYPLIGTGYNEHLNDLIVENAIESVEVNTGINSLLILLAVIFGIPILMIFLYPLIMLIVAPPERDDQLILLSYAMIIPSLLTVGYYSFYLPWVGLGFAASVIFKSTYNKEKVLT